MPTVTAHDVHGKAYTVDTDDLSYWVSSYGIIIRDGKILLLPQFKRGYDFPGGTLDKGETPEQGLVREVCEETGLIVRPLQLLNVYTSFYKGHKDGKFYQCLLFYYHCAIVSGELTDAGFSEAEKGYAEKAEWIDVSKMGGLTYINGADMPDLIERITPIVAERAN